jgi:hypothetical protein
MVDIPLPAPETAGQLARVLSAFVDGLVGRRGGMVLLAKIKAFGAI